MDKYLNIKALREKKNISQVELANRLGVTTKTLRKYEDDPSTMTLGMLSKIMEFFDVVDDGFEDVNMSSPIVNEPGSEYGYSRANILHVPAPAQAGFLGGVIDPIKNSDLFPYYIPGFRGLGYSFEVDGDSMADTLKNGEFVITDRTPITKLNEVSNDFIYVICDSDDIRIKRINLHSEPNMIWLESDNEDFGPDEHPIHPTRTKIYKARRVIKFDLAKKMRFE